MKSRKTAGPSQDLARQSVCLANQLAADIYTAANTQKSRDMLSLLESGKHIEIVSASIDPLEYRESNVDTFRRDYLCVESMSKFPRWDLGINRAEAALAKFFEVEHSLSKLKFVDNPAIIVRSKRATMRAIEMTARIKMAKILGEPNLDEIYSSFAFGPGASTSLPRRRGDAAYKFGAQRPHLSYNALPLADALFKMHPTWDFYPTVVGGSRLVTVPKNAKIDRVICIEPDLNMYFQKGIGAYIRKRLRRWGLLLPQAQQINADLAREGSANGNLATVDLSSASDSIHLGLVGLLSSPAWTDLFELTRSPVTVLPSAENPGTGESHLLRKVSSMGNGYTFELETAIFYCLCSAVIELLASKDMDHRCTVFGDDIIIASELVPALKEVLAYFGFTMNPKKTFSEGPFRESCGKHYFNGTDVTPFYIRDRVDTVPRKYWAANTVRRYARMEQWGLDPRWLPVYNGIVQTIPEKYRRYMIPDGFGDGGLIVDWDEARPSRSTRGHDSWSYFDFVPKTKGMKLSGQGMLLKALHSLEATGSPNVDVERRTTDRFSNEMTGVFLAWSSDLKSEVGTKQFVPNPHLEGVLSVALQQCGLGEHDPSTIPVQVGWKKHEGNVQQWPSYGPWLE